MDFLIFILCIILPGFIGSLITFDSDSEILKWVVPIGLITITFIVVNSFSQNVGIIQSAENLWQSLKTFGYVFILVILGAFFMFVGLLKK